MRPRINIEVTGKNTKLEIFALLDSGADRTVIPEAFAELLKLKKGNKIKTTGIGGSAEGYESDIDLFFIGLNGVREEIKNVPVYVLPNFNDVIIGRNKIFENFKIIFDQKNNDIIFEKIN